MGAVLLGVAMLTTTLGPASSAQTAYTMLFSTSSDRSNASALEGATVGGTIYAFLDPSAGVTQVRFFLDDPQMTGAAKTVERNAPWDFAGTQNGLAKPFNTNPVPEGPHSITAAIDLAGGGTTVLTTTFIVSQGPGPEYHLLASESPDRSGFVPLQDHSLRGNAYVFTSPDEGVSRVRFWLDDPQMTGSPTKTENGAPYDFAGTAKSGGAALPWNTAQVPDGSHTITAVLDLTNGGSRTIQATFSVANAAPVLRFAPNTLQLAAAEGDDATGVVTLEVSDGSADSFALTTNAPWLAAEPVSGTTPAAVTISADSSGLSVGEHSGTVTATSGAFGTAMLTVTLTVGPTGNSYRLFLSPNPDRSGFADLEDQTLQGNAYIFTGPDQGVSRVRFWLDNPQMSGSPIKTENGAPYDFAGTTTSGAALPWDTEQVVDGGHTITAVIDLTSGASQVIQATFNVANDVPSLAFTTDQVAFDVTEEGGTADPQTTGLDTTDGLPAAFTIQDDADWLTVTPASGTTPQTLTLEVDTTGLPIGNYTAIVTATAASHAPANLLVTLAIGTGGCSPLPCSEIRIALPYLLDFGVDHGKIAAGNGVGTGFTYLDPPSNGTGYMPSNLNVDTGQGVFRITTTGGGMPDSDNSQDNALAVGIQAPNQAFIIETDLVDPPPGTGKFEQAGLWFGNDEDNFLKLVTLSTGSGASGTVVEFLMEVNGSRVARQRTSSLDLTGQTLRLTLRANPFDRTVKASYWVLGGLEQQIATFTAPPEFFSFDAAGIDPRIGTRSFGGVFASHRSGQQRTYTFDSFSVVEDTSVSTPTTPDGFSFDRTTFPVPNPTSMVWGPDGRLYVTELLGKIHAITLNDNHQVVNDQVITTLGTRLTLGITVDPDSTPGNVILWVSHSSPSLNNGQVNSSTVSRLSGSGFTTRQDVITGLPRALANHAINSIHFGPDGRLYMAQGGNTGAGAPNLSNTEFGDRPEQPLSAALLVADVKTTGFEGACATPLNQFGVPATCDVSVFASGLRNTYDFVHHSNGNIYGPDNGLGVTGTYPPSPTPDCTGLAQSSQHNPGDQPDILNLLEEGKYYGHPNPYRNECVFKDGSKQGVPPLPNYQPPMLVIGNNTSSNGTIEYQGDAFCGDLQGDVMIANYSVGDNLVRYKLSADGRSVVTTTQIADNFNDPLPVVEGPDGTIYVGELGAGRVTALEPLNTGCWSDRAPVPSQLLDPGGAALAGNLYVVAGKTTTGPKVDMHIYDPATDSWSIGPDLPGPGVEDPAVTALGGKLYVFGGSTSPFSGSVANAAVFDPSAGTWTTLPPMPTPRGGATAEALGGLIYVAGGRDGSGGSVATVDVFDPTTNTWSTGPSMATRRDNARSAVLDGRLYVFGGRTRNADGTTVNGTLASVEMLDPSSGTWVPRAPMPTGRRAMVVGTLNGRAQVMGGEASGVGVGTFPQNEEYDPVANTWRSLRNMKTPRHGAAAGTIDGVIYVVAGGPSSGSSFSNINEAFAPQQA